MPPKIQAQQNWSKKMDVSKNSQSNLVEDESWMIPFTFTAANQTSFVCKTGNKEYSLDGSSSDFRNRTSELILKRKYR
jgi:hypothetical protein